MLGLVKTSSAKRGNSRGIPRVGPKSPDSIIVKNVRLHCYNKDEWSWELQHLRGGCRAIPVERSTDDNYSDRRVENDKDFA